VRSRNRLFPWLAAIVVAPIHLLLTPLASTAAVVNADGHPATSAAHPGAILDEASGLLWLDATATDGRSLADVSGKLGPGAEFDGWRLATRDELLQLFLNAGLYWTSHTSNPPFTDEWREDSDLVSDVMDFVGIYGMTQPNDFCGAMGMNVWHANTHDDPDVYASEATLWDLSCGWFSHDGVPVAWVGDNGIDSINAGAANSDFGVALVRSASAVVLDFDDLIPGSDIYEEDGFRMEANGGFNQSASGTPPPSMFPAATAQVNTLTSQGGQPFDLLSIDISELNFDVGSQTIIFTGTLASGGSVSQSFTTDGPFGFEAFDFSASFRNLGSVSWDQMNPLSFAIYDSIVVAVPEPSLWVLQLASLTVIAALARRRARS
jgi:hypothetical protein